MRLDILYNLILYGIFGVLTTLLNIFVYWLFTRIFIFQVVPATIIAWIIAVLFAYFTNRKFVFHSKNYSLHAILTEAGEFFLCRLITGLIDVFIMFVFVDILALNDVVIKTISNILVIILNYIASKLFIFKAKS